MRSPAEALFASPSWVVARRHAAHAAAFAAAWVLLWTLFIAGVAWPASQLHAIGRTADSVAQVQLAAAGSMP
ncbi:MAG: hypothetical protein ACJ79R_18595 [Anaeromyxobacteraceae bacterium]